MDGLERPVWNRFHSIPSLHKLEASGIRQVPSLERPLRANELTSQCSVRFINRSFYPTLSLSLYHVFDRVKIRSRFFVWEEGIYDE